MYTLGEYLYKQLLPKTEAIHINIINLEVTKGLVAQKSTATPQFIRVSIATDNINSGEAKLVWQNVHGDGSLSDPFATCQVLYGDAEKWLSSWSPLEHLIHGRIQSLESLATEGVATRFSHSMAYTLFANNLVDYADKYRGMQVVVVKDFEAFADVTLKQVQGGGNFTVPPYFIDSVAHLAGFIMNVSDMSDTANTFCVTPGWSSMRFARPLVAGQKYRSYVKMIPTSEDPTMYLGDVYILQHSSIMGMVGGIKFRRYPRLLMNRFFSAPDSATAKSYANDNAAVTKAAAAAPAVKSAPTTASLVPPPSSSSQKAISVVPPQTSSPEAKAPSPPAPSAATVDSDSTARKALMLTAKEAGLDVSDLTDDASFANLGIDSLMSLVIAEKFREDLGIAVGGSLFLEYPTIGALRMWLEEYYS